MDAKNKVLCPQCEAKLENGSITEADVEASIKLVSLIKKEPDVNRFTLFSCREIGENMIIILSKSDIATVRKSRTMYRNIRSKFKKMIWLVDADNTDERFIENLLFPTKVLSVNSVWAPGGKQKAKAIISGKWSPKFPIDTDRVKRIVKDVRNLDVEIEFEIKAGR